MLRSLFSPELNHVGSSILIFMSGARQLIWGSTALTEITIAGSRESRNHASSRGPNRHELSIRWLPRVTPQHVIVKKLTGSLSSFGRSFLRDESGDQDWLAFLWDATQTHFVLH